jgi:hypothetical protein
LGWNLGAFQELIRGDGGFYRVTAEKLATLQYPPMTQTPRTNLGSAETSAPVAPWWLVALGLISVFYATFLLFLIPVWHDESHFLHSSWLMSRGLEPYEDFLYHQPRMIVDVLNTLAWFKPNFGVEILWWGRGICALALLGTCYWIVRLSKLLGNICYGYAGITIYCIFSTLLYSPSNMRHQQFCIRPEIFAMPFVMWMIYLILKWLDNPRAIKPLEIISSAVVAAIPLCMSSRTIFVYLGIGLLLVSNIKKLNKQHWAALGLTGFLIALYMVTIQGIETFYQWIYLFSKYLREGHSLLHWLRINGLRVPIGCVILYACILSWFSANTSLKRLCLIFACMTVGIFMEPFPGLQAWQIQGALASFMFWFALAETANLFRSFLGLTAKDQSAAKSWRTVTARIGIVLLVALPMLYMVYQARSVLVLARYWYHPEYRLSGQIETFQEFCDALGNETAICVQRNLPIACFEASFIGSGLDLYSRVVARIPNFHSPAHDIFEDIQKNKPAFTRMLSPKSFASVEEYERRKPELDEFFATYYEPWKGDFYLLRSSPAKQRLLEVLNTPGGELHMFTALTVKTETVSEVLNSLP